VVHGGARSFWSLQLLACAKAAHHLGSATEPEWRVSAALAGYGDKARYTVRGSAGQKWLDVVRGKVACEARFALDDNGNPLNRDRKEVGGKLCVAALALP
jgi:hypothetical protein